MPRISAGPLRWWWLVLPVLLVGLCARAYYTPDEPREASLVLAMAGQAQQAVPELGGRYFMEKPPLLYWLGAASAGAIGAVPAAVRLPGLLYGLLACAAMAFIARRAAGELAGFTAAVVAATALLSYQVAIWLATDAPLLGGVALSLAGLYLGFTSTQPRGRRVGYGAFHLGLLVAFFSKNVAGWMVPVLAFATLVVLERRWREPLRVEVLAGAVAIGVPIAAWIVAVALLPEGTGALKVFFWNNLVGRAVDVGGTGPYTYTAGHLNSPGKYLLELPLYLFPWTPLAIAAAVHAWGCVRAPGDRGTAWRLGIGAIVPATVLLSVAATARGVYYGPPLLGFALLIALYVAEAPAARGWLRATAVLVALEGVLVAGLTLLLAVSPRERGWPAPTLAFVACAGAGCVAALAVRAFRAGRLAEGILPLAIASCTTLTLGAAPLYACLNPALDLGSVARRLSAVAPDARLALYDPDETTEALAELYLPAARSLEPGAGALRTDAWIVFQDPGRRSWKLAEWLAWLGYRADPPVTVRAPHPAALAGWVAQCGIERPGGRLYWLYSPPGTVRRNAPCRAVEGRMP